MFSNNESDLRKAKFWIDKINDFDAAICDIPKLEDAKANLNEIYRKFLNSKTSSIEAENIRRLIEASFPDMNIAYSDEDRNSIRDSKIEKMIKNTSISELDNSKKYQIKYGFAMKRSEMRALPSEETICKMGDELNFDRLSESAIYSYESFVELLKSHDDKWSFIVSPYYNAWVKSEDLAYTSYEKWKDYIEYEDFLIVKESVININAQGENTDLYMGTKVNLSRNKSSDIVINIPCFLNASDEIIFRDIKLTNLQGFTKGYMTCNARNIIELAFKMLDESYGWGSCNNLRDCSSFIQDIYKCFNIHIHRNSSDQWLYSRAISYHMRDDMSEDDRKSLLINLKIPTPIYKEGHVMLYIGEYDSEPYIIHNAASIYSYDMENHLREERVMKVLLSPLSIMNKDGKKIINLLQGAKKFY